jgi:hypothetical protein
MRRDKKKNLFEKGADKGTPWRRKVEKGWMELPLLQSSTSF